MKIARDPSSRLWTLTSGRHVLYAGRKSPWEDPRVMREALQRESTMNADASAEFASEPNRTARAAH